jgi:hypothetical protein
MLSGRVLCCAVCGYAVTGESHRRRLCSARLKAQLAEGGRQVGGVGAVTEENGRPALSVFDFSQNLAGLWRGSNFASRRTILECVSSNRLLSGASLVLVKRRPFDFLAERPFLKNGRGDWQNLEREVQPYAAVFLRGPEPHILRIGEIMRQTA